MGKLMCQLGLLIVSAVLLFSGRAFAVDVPSEVLLFKNVKVFNGTDNTLFDLDVLVMGNKIHKVEKDISQD